MKKTYIQPQSATVSLFVENSLLTGSKVLNVDGDTTIDAGDARSMGKGWSADNWSGADED